MKLFLAGTRVLISERWSKCETLSRLEPLNHCRYSGRCSGISPFNILWKRIRSLSLNRHLRGSMFTCLHLRIYVSPWLYDSSCSESIHLIHFDTSQKEVSYKVSKVTKSDIYWLMLVYGSLKEVYWISKRNLGHFHEPMNPNKIWWK